VNKLRSQQDFLPVAGIAQSRVRIVGDDLSNGLERILSDVVFVVDRQLDGYVMDAIGTQHRQRIRTSRLQQQRRQKIISPLVHCSVLPPDEFNRIMAVALLIYSAESFILTAVTVANTGE